MVQLKGWYELNSNNNNSSSNRRDHDWIFNWLAEPVDDWQKVGCLQCGKPSPLSKRNNKPTKYCSKACTNKYLHTKNRVSIARPGWGDGSKAKKERLAELARLEQDPNMLTPKDAGRELQISWQALHHRAKKLNIVATMGTTRHGGQKTWWTRDQVEQLRNYYEVLYPMPDGCILNVNVAEYLGLDVHTIKSRVNADMVVWDRRRTLKKEGLFELKFQGSVVRNGAPSQYYLKADVDEFYMVWHDRIAAKKLKIETRIKEREQRLKREREAEAKRYEEATKGLLTSKEFAAACGLKVFPQHFGIEPHRRMGGLNKLFYHPSQVEVYRQWKEESVEASRAEAPFGRMTNGKPRRIPLREDDWTAPRNYVQKRMASEARNIKKGTMNSTRQKQVLYFREDGETWQKNNFKNPAQRVCSKCKQSQPFYEFYPDRGGKCKTCEVARNLPRKKDNPRHLFQNAFILTIKRELSRGAKKFNSTPNVVMWNKIEEAVGYDKERLTAHVESLFEPWMGWDNWGRSRKNKSGRCWEMDHIVPRSKYKYESVNCAEFKEIWNINNLQPLSRKDNSKKGDK